jgi:hypothetical protein
MAETLIIFFKNRLFSLQFQWQLVYTEVFCLLPFSGALDRKRRHKKIDKGSYFKESGFSSQNQGKGGTDGWRDEKNSTVGLGDFLLFVPQR